MGRMTAGIIAVIAMFASTGLAAAQTADKFKGKVFEVIVGYDTGGGYDIYARALARHIGKHLPGNPTVIVKNMPGAQTRTAANYLYNIAPKDGTVIATIARGLPTEELLGSGGIRFESAKFNWIGSMNNEVSVGVAWHTSPVKTFEDTKKREMLVGAIADSLLFAQVMNAVLDTKFKPISGYKSGAEIGLAMQRGEVEGRMGWSWSSVVSMNPEWIREGKIRNLVQFSTSKHADLPNVPLVTELANNDADRALLELVFSRQVIGRPFIAPPGLDAETVQILRKAFDDTMHDPAFVAEMQKANLEVNPISGKDVQGLIDRLFKTPPAVLERAKTIIPVEK
ncbi:MAG TPA: tripartite tricarboxylate transporter substrate-binding protein [Xanthobacteraceae bacterium]|nr:tripartite tricarboxylate transporter substrate-binding protein [Xanthobacteraceae bacterium]